MAECEILFWLKHGAAVQKIDANAQEKRQGQ